MQDQLDEQNANNKTEPVFINRPYVFIGMVYFVLFLYLLSVAVFNHKWLAVIVMLIVTKIWLKVFPIGYSFYADRIVIKRLLHSDKVIHKEEMERIEEKSYVPGMYFGSGPVIKLKDGKVVPIGSGIKWDQPKLVMKIAAIYDIEYTLVK